MSSLCIVYFFICLVQNLQWVILIFLGEGGGGGKKLPCFSVALLSLVQMIDFTVGYSSTNSTVQNILKGYALS